MKPFFTYKALVRAVLSVCLFACTLVRTSFAQSETNNPITYDTTISETANGEGPFTWQVRVTRQQNDNSLRPVLLSMPGSGETGTSTANLVAYGPHYWLLNGWNGGVKLGNGTHYPIIITLEQPAQNMRPWHLKAVVETLLKIFPIKPGSVHVAGLSQGSYEWGELIGFSAYSGDQTAMSEIKSWVDLQGVGPGDNFLGFDAAYPGVYGTWASKYGGRFFGLEGTQDSRNIWQITQAMNAAKANSAYFSYENLGGGGHCCWNSMYDPSVTNWQNVGTITNANIVASTNPASTMGSYSVNPTTGTNIFQWMLRQGDTTLAAGSTASVPVTPAPPAPTVTIGAAQTLTLPTNSTTLTSSATAGAGTTLKSCTWSQVSGPNTAAITTPAAWNTTVTGMIAGAYVFQVSVKDTSGNTSTAKVAVTVVLSSTPIAPILTISSAQTITLPTSSVTVSGTASARVGGYSIHSVTWSQVSGPGTATLATPTQWSTAATGLVAGTYGFKMTVTDGGSNAYTLTTNVTVNANSAVVVTAPATGSTPKILVAPGEYQCFFIDEHKKLYGVGANLRTLGVNSTGKPGATLAVAVPSNLSFQTAAAGLHGGAAVDTTGHVWTWGDNDQGQSGNGTTSTDGQLSPVQITTDASGNSFTGVTALTAYFSGNASSGWLAIKSDGTLWIWGQTLGGMSGNGTAGSTAQTRPVQVPVPGSRQVAQVVGGDEMIVLCTDGTVWTGGGYGRSSIDLGYTISGTSYLSLQQLTSLTGITQIAGGGSFNYALKSNGTLYGWGYYGYYMGGTGGSTSNTPLAVPTDLTTRLNLPHPVKTIVTDMVCTHVILSDGTLWGWGDNAQGGIGNGKELNYANTTNPYAWDFYPAELLQQTPVQITTRTDFVGLFSTEPFVMYTYAETADGTLYSWGRNKGGVLGNGIVGCSSVAATYPNSWDVPAATIVTPLAITNVTIVPSPYCISHPATAPCNQCALVNTIQASAETLAVTTSEVATPVQAVSGTVEQILVYPTVTSGNLMLRIISDTNGIVRASIYDINGKMVQSTQMDKQGTYLDKTFDVGRLPAGMYLLQVLIGDRKRMVSKFIKQ